MNKKQKISTGGIVIIILIVFFILFCVLLFFADYPIFEDGDLQSILYGI